MGIGNDLITDYLELTTDIVSNFVSKNSVPTSDIPVLIASVHATLGNLSKSSVSIKVEPLIPAVSIRRSVTPDFIICLEDGKKFKSLKRHLRAHCSMTPEEYRSKWNLPSNYPMVAPNYAATRSKLAKNMGLGQQRKKVPHQDGIIAELAPTLSPRGRLPRAATAAK